MNVTDYYRAVFWSDFGTWSTSGCRTVIDDGNITVCECRQLGHFGILFVSKQGYPRVLKHTWHV